MGLIGPVPVGFLTYASFPILRLNMIKVFNFRNYTPGIYAAGYIVFALTFVRSSVRMFVRSFVRQFVRSFVCLFVRYFPSRS